MEKICKIISLQPWFGNRSESGFKETMVKKMQGVKEDTVAKRVDNHVTVAKPENCEKLGEAEVHELSTERLSPSFRCILHIDRRQGSR
jgi:hypothetical protein